MTNQNLPGFDPTDAEWVAEMPLAERLSRAIELLKSHEPEDGYYLAFSGGKDSCAVKEIAKLSGVKFEAFYNQTTIDPPELVRFIKQEHQDVKWNIPKHGNMMHRVATKPGLPPTRTMRWCCQEYKEGGGHGRVKLFGVRAAESAARKKRWVEVAIDSYRNLAICPIVFWTDSQVWEFLRSHNVKYCSLYDEGWTRLGCVGCPLADKANQDREFERWPAFERNWKAAVVKNWELYHDKPRNDGKPRYQSRFSSGEQMWNWWRNHTPAEAPEECQTGKLWTS